MTKVEFPNKACNPFLRIFGALFLTLSLFFQTLFLNNFDKYTFLLKSYFFISTKNSFKPTKPKKSLPRIVPAPTFFDVNLNDFLASAFNNSDQWELPGDERAHRRLSVKEIARIQTFSDWFRFSDGGNKKISDNGRLNKVYKQIGNAVPVELARAIARPIAEYCATNFEQLKEKRKTTKQLQLF